MHTNISHEREQAAKDGVSISIGRLQTGQLSSHCPVASRRRLCDRGRKKRGAGFRETRMRPHLYSILVLPSLISLTVLTLVDTALPGRPVAHADDALPQPRKMSRAAASRWIDDHLGRTTLWVFFERPNDPPCFALGGLFSFRSAGFDIIYPTSVAPNLSIGSVPTADGRLLTLQQGNCRIHLHVSKDIVNDQGRWVKLVSSRP